MSPPAVRRMQLTLSTVTILACLPYLVLKLCWLAGNHVGLTAVATDLGATLWVLNLGTLVMDAYAGFLAVAFVAPWRERVPAVVMMFPLWIACGFLAVILVGAPIQLLLGGGTDVEGGPAEAWVYAVVYPGFFLLGVGLLGNFAIDVWRRRLRVRRRLDIAAPATVLTVLLALVVLTLVIAQLRAERAAPVITPALGGCAVLVAAGVLLARRSVSQWAGLLLWFGGAPLVSWGGYGAVLAVLPHSFAEGMAEQAVVGFLQLLLGSIAAVAVYRMLATSASGRPVGATDSVGTRR